MSSTGQPTWTALRDRAEALGQEHGKAGIKPYGDLSTPAARIGAPGIPALLAELGVTYVATDYHAQDLLNAYQGGWCWGADVCFQCGASGATEDVNADLYCTGCAAEWAGEDGDRYRD